MIKFCCENCGRKMGVPETMAGKRAKCPACGQAVQIPAASVAPPPTRPPSKTPTDYNLRVVDPPKDTIRFFCDNCGRRLGVPASLAGKTGKCPGCNEQVEVPLESPAIPPSRAARKDATDYSLQIQEAVGQTRLRRCIGWIRRLPNRTQRTAAACAALAVGLAFVILVKSRIAGPDPARPSARTVDSPPPAGVATGSPNAVLTPPPNSGGQAAPSRDRGTVEAERLAESYDVSAALPGAVEFAYDRPLPMTSAGILKQLVFRRSGAVGAHYRNDTEQRVKPDVLVWVLNKDGVVLWAGKDSWSVDSLEPGKEDDRAWSCEFKIDPRFAFSRWAHRPGAWDLRPRWVLAVGSKHALDKLVAKLVDQVGALAQSGRPAADGDYSVASAFPEAVPFALDSQIALPSSGIVKRVIFSSQPYVDAHYLNDTEQRVKPDVIVWVLNREGVVLWDGEDSWLMDDMEPDATYKKSWTYKFQIDPYFAFSRWARAPGGWDLKPAHIVVVGSKYAFDQLVSRVVAQVQALNQRGESSPCDGGPDPQGRSSDGGETTREGSRVEESAPTERAGSSAPADPPPAPCQACGGRGQWRCPECNEGQVTRQCETCKGDRYVTCQKCRGNGFVDCGCGGRDYKCPDCHGSGQIRCKACEGRGTKQCPRCKGQGKVTTSCPHCRKGVVTCAECDGTGHMLSDAEKAEKAAGSLLVSAKAFETAKAFDTASEKYKDIIAKYPGTKAAKEATERLDALKPPK